MRSDESPFEGLLRRAVACFAEPPEGAPATLLSHPAAAPKSIERVAVRSSIPIAVATFRASRERRPPSRLDSRSRMATDPERLLAGTAVSTRTRL
jgi:hypothetical protein